MDLFIEHLEDGLEVRDILFVHLDGLHVDIDGDEIDVREVNILVTARNKDHDLANVLHQLLILCLQFLILLLFLRSIVFIFLLVDSRLLIDGFLSGLSDLDCEFLLL